MSAKGREKDNELNKRAQIMRMSREKTELLLFTLLPLLLASLMKLVLGRNQWQQFSYNLFSYFKKTIFDTYINIGLELNSSNPALMLVSLVFVVVLTPVYCLYWVLLGDHQRKFIEPNNVNEKSINVWIALLATFFILIYSWFIDDESSYRKGKTLLVTYSYSNEVFFVFCYIAPPVFFAYLLAGVIKLRLLPN